MDNKYGKLVLLILEATQKASSNQLLKDNLGAIIKVESESEVPASSMTTATQEQIAEPTVQPVAAIAAPAPKPEAPVEAVAPTVEETKVIGE